MELLPYDMIQVISNYIHPLVIVKLRMVSRDFLSIFTNDDLWSYINSKIKNSFFETIKCEKYENNYQLFVEYYKEMRDIKKVVKNGIFNNGKIKTISSLLGQTNLYVRDKHVEYIPKGIFKLNYFGLTSLMLYNNVITEIPKEISHLYNLTHLNIIYNDLTSLPEEIELLSKLRVLRLNSNRFVEIPSCIFKLAKLKILHMQNNRISVIDNNECLFTKLKSLKLGHNEIEIFPNTFYSLYKLKKLNMWNNKLTYIDVRPFVKLRYLNLAENQLNKLDIIPSEMTSLRIIRLQENLDLDTKLDKNLLPSCMSYTANSIRADDYDEFWSPMATTSSSDSVSSDYDMYFDSVL